MINVPFHFRIDPNSANQLSTDLNSTNQFSADLNSIMHSGHMSSDERTVSALRAYYATVCNAVDLAQVPQDCFTLPTGASLFTLYHSALY